MNSGSSEIGTFRIYDGQWQAQIPDFCRVKVNPELIGHSNLLTGDSTHMEEPPTLRRKPLHMPTTILRGNYKESHGKEIFPTKALIFEASVHPTVGILPQDLLKQQ